MRLLTTRALDHPGKRTPGLRTRRPGADVQSVRVDGRSAQVFAGANSVVITPIGRDTTIVSVVSAVACGSEIVIECVVADLFTDSVPHDICGPEVDAHPDAAVDRVGIELTLELVVPGDACGGGRDVQSMWSVPMTRVRARASAPVNPVKPLM